MYTFFSSEDNSSVFLFLSDKVLDMDHLDEMMTFNLVSNTSSCCDSWFRIRRAEAQSVTRGGLHLSRMDHERTIHHFHEPERSHCEPALRLSVPPLQLSD